MLADLAVLSIYHRQ